MYTISRSTVTINFYYFHCLFTVRSKPSLGFSVQLSLSNDLILVVTSSMALQSSSHQPNVIVLQCHSVTLIQCHSVTASLQGFCFSFLNTSPHIKAKFQQLLHTNFLNHLHAAWARGIQSKSCAIYINHDSKAVGCVRVEETLELHFTG